MITLISAVSNDWSVGHDNKMLWHLPSELKLFKERTLNKTVIMGRRTFESIGSKPLPNRTNMVIGSGYLTLEDVLDNISNREDNYYIIGGRSIWEQFIPIADNAYITHVETDITGDIKFPQKVFKEYFTPYHIGPTSSEDILSYTVIEYHKKILNRRF